MVIIAEKPRFLPGNYDLQHKSYRKLKNIIKSTIKDNNYRDVWTKLMLGADFVVGEAVQELKSEGYDVKLHVVFPYRNVELSWSRESKLMLQDLTHLADTIEYSYDNRLDMESDEGVALDRRDVAKKIVECNNQMIDHANDVFVIDAKNRRGAINNTAITYAKENDKKVYLIELDKDDAVMSALF